MKRTNVLIVPLAFTILFCTETGMAQDAYTGEFGVTEGKPIDKGVVFVDGQYLASPYVVSRRGLALYVNDREIQRPRRHMETPILTPDTPISRLSPQERQRLYRALEATRGIYEKYLSRGYGYLFSSKGGHVKLHPYTIGYKLPEAVELLTSDVSRDEKLEGLRDYNWHLHIDIGPLVDNFRPASQLVSTMTQQAEELLRIEEFGIGEPVSVTSGFFFLDGQYMEAPYVLRRRGLGVFLNGELLSPPREWPLDVPSGDADVSIPPEIDSETSWFDDIVGQYLGRKQAYLYGRYPHEQAVDMIAQAITSLPLVAGARRDEKSPKILHVATTEGLTIPCWLPPMSMRAAHDRESVLQSVEGDLNHFRKMLGRSACYLVFHDAGQTCLPRPHVGRTLPAVVELLGSVMPAQAKRAAIKRLCPGMPERARERLVRNFRASPQLEARIAAVSRKSARLPE